MSELKATSSGEIRARNALLGYWWYEQSEADKVIAELKEKYKTEVKELLCLIRDKDNNFNHAFDSEEKELRHNKYKRCLAMAKWCKAGMYLSYESDFKREWWNKWHKRWLKLAEKFKDKEA